MARRITADHVPSSWRICGRCECPSDVRRVGVLDVPTCARWCRADVQRIRRHVWVIGCHLGLCAPASGGDAFAVGAYITSAYWFTASTSFANPAVTVARAFTDTFAGVRPVDVPLFIVAKIGGAVAATGLFQWLTQALPPGADRVIVAHDKEKAAAGEVP